MIQCIRVLEAAAANPSPGREPAVSGIAACNGPALLGRIVCLGFRVHCSLISSSPLLPRLWIDRSLPLCSEPPGVSACTAGLCGFIFCPLDESYGTVTPRRQMTMIPPFERGLNT